MQITRNCNVSLNRSQTKSLFRLQRYAVISATRAFVEMHDYINSGKAAAPLLFHRPLPDKSRHTRPTTALIFTSARSRAFKNHANYSVHSVCAAYGIGACCARLYGIGSGLCRSLSGHTFGSLFADLSMGRIDARCALIARSGSGIQSHWFFGLCVLGSTAPTMLVPEATVIITGAKRLNEHRYY